ncbi:hypothetical protein PMZ66_10040 [Clostridium paraputrificum]|uniref:hypothetical protein n=1 Tax=Clostridium TaxID=1485 RepID=UPI00189DE064|nr:MULTISPECIES: hypothetical protein [Clostridium]MDB2075946.1 hypothetical protein [Clostridium paraputrificum]MDB2079246.1 hypothetical protein [Clostridium paraputrificum]MDB2084587.1 hypothetical protein [Clostridium paraputrificum]MDB2099458.1 hypothetical protein [Clostridium paraputrificum]MDU1031706.1 hypothetical protein [Clostridium sp.]
MDLIGLIIIFIIIISIKNAINGNGRLYSGHDDGPWYGDSGSHSSGWFFNNNDDCDCGFDCDCNCDSGDCDCGCDD